MIFFIFERIIFTCYYDIYCYYDIEYVIQNPHLCICFEGFSRFFNGLITGLVFEVFYRSAAEDTMPDSRHESVRCITLLNYFYGHAQELSLCLSPHPQIPPSWLYNHSTNNLVHHQVIRLFSHCFP